VYRDTVVSLWTLRATGKEKSDNAQFLIAFALPGSNDVSRRGSPTSTRDLGPTTHPSRRPGTNTRCHHPGAYPAQRNGSCVLPFVSTPSTMGPAWEEATGFSTFRAGRYTSSRKPGPGGRERSPARQNVVHISRPRRILPANRTRRFQRTPTDARRGRAQPPRRQATLSSWARSCPRRRHWSASQHDISTVP